MRDGPAQAGRTVAAHLANEFFVLICIVQPSQDIVDGCVLVKCRVVECVDVHRARATAILVGTTA